MLLNRQPECQTNLQPVVRPDHQPEQYHSRRLTEVLWTGQVRAETVAQPERPIPGVIQAHQQSLRLPQEVVATEAEEEDNNISFLKAVSVTRQPFTFVSRPNNGYLIVA